MAKSKGKSKSIPSAVPNRASVDIKKVNNGFVVSSYDYNSGKEKSFIANTLKDAQGYANKLLKLPK